jgi:translation initiation factor IF-2
MRQIPSGGQRPGQRPQGGQGGPQQGGNQQGGNQQGGQGNRQPNQGGGQQGNRPQNQGGHQGNRGPSGRPIPGGANQQGGNRPGQPQQQAGGGRPEEKKPPQQPTAPAQHGGARKIADIPPELLAAMQGRETPISVKEIEDKIRDKEKAQTPGKQDPPPGVPARAPAQPVENFDEEERNKNKKRGKGPATHVDASVPGRADRHKERTERQAKRKGDEPTRGKPSLLLDDENQRHRKDRRPKIKLPGTLQRKGKTPISLPITVRSLSEALGRKVGEVLLKLIGHGMSQLTTINSQIESEMAELIALDYNCELEIKRDVDVEQDLIDINKIPDRPEDLVLRAPVVVIMGHVDHGKTSLLDRIRRSNVVDTEAGGITQVIRAWRVDYKGHPVTFLDTPGHEAFTKMRARGANVTDVAVIVVAANDGVMPQTEEAINHAKAAGVSIVVAINKVDLPDANLKKVESQLMSMGLVPDTMGGECPFVYTSAKTGKGIDDLLEQLALVAELKELKANPNKPASGTCLEAYLSEREGVQATVLVQNGTLKPGDIVLCGATYGSVRRMYDDHGRGVETAGPSMPVRIIGLDSVPNGDDPFLVVPDVGTARDIAEDRKAKLLEKSQKVRVPVTLETLKDAKIAELKVILKAEARGSIEAIRNELEKLHHDEVRVKILHTAIGGITTSDVQLAMTSPEDTLILGFNVVPDTESRQMAEERGIRIREYDIIYKLADDIKSALEGKLKPREEIVFLGRANVRETFKIRGAGVVAGCFVTQGTIDRSAKIRVIRNGVVVYPPVDKTAGLDSLKRYKDDVKEVREGFECGMKLAGYDDIKVGDAIEAYRIDQVMRTL